VYGHGKGPEQGASNPERRHGMSDSEKLIPPHGGYRDLKSYQMAEIFLIHQADYLLDQQLRALEKAFLDEGGFTERLYRVRTEARGASRRSEAGDRKSGSESAWKPNEPKS